MSTSATWSNQQQTTIKRTAFFLFHSCITGQYNMKPQNPYKATSVYKNDTFSIKYIVKNVGIPVQYI